MNYKVKGKITSIGEKKALDNGAVVLDYIVETEDNGYVTPLSFNIYKSTDYIDQIDKFLEYNSVGDNVEVEFSIRGRLYNDRVYNSLSHWKINKIQNTVEIEDDGSGLPF